MVKHKVLEYYWTFSRVDVHTHVHVHAAHHQKRRLWWFIKATEKKKKKTHNWDSLFRKFNLLNTKFTTHLGNCVGGNDGGGGGDDGGGLLLPCQLCSFIHSLFLFSFFSNSFSHFDFPSNIKKKLPNQVSTHFVSYFFFLPT